MREHSRHHHRLCVESHDIACRRPQHRIGQHGLQQHRIQNRRTVGDYRRRRQGKNPEEQSESIQQQGIRKTRVGARGRRDRRHPHALAGQGQERMRNQSLRKQRSHRRDNQRLLHPSGHRLSHPHLAISRPPDHMLRCRIPIDAASFIGLLRREEVVVDEPPDKGVDERDDEISPSPRLWKPNPVGNPKQKGSHRNI